MRFKISDVVGKPSPLPGAALGRAVLGKLVEACPLPDEPTVCFIDFLDIDLATASFLRESVIAFRDYTRQRRSMLYPVIANASAGTLDDLYAVLVDRNDAITACNLDAQENIISTRIVGRLDEKQRQTLDLVRQIEDDGGIADTATLCDLRPEEGVQTLWNNRLAALVEKGLLVEFVSGRAKRFRSIASVGG